MNSTPNFEAHQDREIRHQRSTIKVREMRALGWGTTVVYGYMPFWLFYTSLKVPQLGPVNTPLLAVTIVLMVLALMYLLALYKLWNTESAALTRWLAAPCVIVVACLVWFDWATGTATLGWLLFGNVFAIAAVMYVAYLRGKLAKMPKPSKRITADEWVDQWGDQIGNGQQSDQRQ